MGKKLKDFLAENPDITIIGLAWSLFWRIHLLLFVAYFGFIVVMMFIASFLASL